MEKLTFPFGSDCKFTLIPKIGEETLKEADMVDLKVKVINVNRGIDFLPIWEWGDAGIEIEIQRELIPVAGGYQLVLDWRKPASNYSDGFKDIRHACVMMVFSTDCSVITDKLAIVELGLNYSVIHIVEEFPEHGNPGEFYAIIEDAGEE